MITYIYLHNVKKRIIIVSYIYQLLPLLCEAQNFTLHVQNQNSAFIRSLNIQWNMVVFIYNNLLEKGMVIVADHSCHECWRYMQKFLDFVNRKPTLAKINSEDLWKIVKIKTNMFLWVWLRDCGKWRSNDKVHCKKKKSTQWEI